MRLEELKNELPEIPDDIHNMILEEVEKQVSKGNIAPMKRKHRFKWNMSRVAVAAVTCIVATATITYAGTKLYHMYLEKQGTYLVSTRIKENESEESLKLPKEIHDISITSKYIPKGMKWTKKGSRLNYKNSIDQGGISINSVLMDKKDLKEVLKDSNVVESEEHNFGTYEGVYLKYHSLKEDKSFDQKIYLLCPENYRILVIDIGHDVSKTDAYKFAENLVIKETDEMVKTDSLYTWSDMVHSKVGAEESRKTNGQVPMHAIGDSFTLKSASGEDGDGNTISTDKISVCVDDVKIANDLQLLDHKKIPENWKKAVDKNGNLVQNHLSYIKQGDGVESVDKVVKEENVAQKLVFATVTYTNTSDKEIKHMPYLGSLMSLKKQKNGTYTAYSPAETAGDGYDYYTGDSVAKMAEMRYSSIKENHGNGGNYIASLKPGESVQVNMAWIVNEKDLKNMYLNLNDTGAVYELDDAVLNSGVVYIGK